MKSLTMLIEQIELVKNSSLTDKQKELLIKVLKEQEPKTPEVKKLMEEVILQASKDS